MRMSKKKLVMKLAAISVFAVITAGTLTYMPTVNTTPVVAKTISDLEAEKAENAKKIKELQKEIDSYESDIQDSKEKQKELQDQIDLQNKNIDIVNSQIETLNKDIKEKEQKISDLEVDIDNKQDDIDEGLEQFKDRLLAMYVNGNDSLASALVGSTDFYDMLSRIELISSVAKHDDDLINSLKTQLEQFEEAKAQLAIERDDLNKSLDEQEKYKKELNDEIKKLNAASEKSKEIQQSLENEKASRERKVSEKKKENDAIDSEVASIQAAIKKRQADEAKKAAARKAAQSSVSNSSSSNNSSSNNSSSSNSSNTSSSTAGNGSISGTSGSGSYSGTLGWPVPGFNYISSGYGYRWGSLHGGLDIAGGGISGASVCAAESGTVILVKTGCPHNSPKHSSCGCNGGFGNYVVIDHGNGLSTLYGHCASVNVSVSQSVSRGQSIGSVGATGYSTGYHLHFEVHVNGSRVNPAPYLGR